MILERFEADGFRNLRGFAIEPHPSLNYLVGPNGAGKSSVLEAMQCLAMGHGFRSRRYRDHLAHDADEYLLRAELAEHGGISRHRCGVRRGRDGQLDLKLDFAPLASFAELARLLPVKVLTPDSHQLIQGAPEERRRFLDWGCFHADESFHPAWRRFRRALSQRNELLREGAPDGEVRSWDEAIALDGTALQALRSAYVDRLKFHVEQRLATVGFVFHVELELRSGWSRERSLGDALERNLDQHRRMRTTTDGPHRAELVVRVDGRPARDVLSRGQQKLLVYLLHLAQVDELAGRTGGSEDDAGRVTRPVVLCDDLGSELDVPATTSLLRALVGTGSQVFVSGVTLPPAHARDIADDASEGGSKSGDVPADTIAIDAADTTFNDRGADPSPTHSVFELADGRVLPGRTG